VDYTGTLFPSGEQFDSSTRRGTFKFDLGRGAVIRGWDVGVATMRVGEKAEFILAPNYAYGARGAPPRIPPNSTLKFEVELHGFTQAQRLKAALKYKESGNALFKSSNWDDARAAYEKALGQLDDVWEETDEEKAEILAARIAVLSNLAAVLLKLKQYREAVARCNDALARDAKQSKVLYRLAQAQLGLGEFDAAVDTVQKGLEVRDGVG
ncbi:hypothetical protein THASP1DRAFT_20266, partial [Thamnocephalis sphaerospora]